ncbi:ferritin-like domain-containing protein [Haladaptatus sp. CMAA 1911]|uniref:YciE/YciF ferroxidase family protein n=1 Tax=unclassified Haladaptatus TaxID=2622732 RepID=UPI003754E9E6
MSGETLNDLFQAGLKEMYYVENELFDALDELATEVDHGDLQNAFEEHRSETRDHVDRLESVFDHIGVAAEQKQLYALDGLIEDHDEFTDENPEQEVLNLFDKAAAEKSEHLEIAAYGNLAFMADKLGHDEAADLLEENLREEENALDELKSISEQYDVESVPMQG